MVVRTRLRVTLYVQCLSFSQCPIFYVRVCWNEHYRLIFDVLPFVLSNGADQIVYVYITLLWPASWYSGQGLWLLIMRSRFVSRFYHGNFSLQGKIPVVTMVWVVSRFRIKAPPGISSSCISPLTSSGLRSRASWASQPQKSAALLPQPGGKPRKFIRTCGGIGRKKNITLLFSQHHDSKEDTHEIANCYQ